jgi:hypothetical protein
MRIVRLFLADICFAVVPAKLPPIAPLPPLGPMPGPPPRASCG